MLPESWNPAVQCDPKGNLAALPGQELHSVRNDD